MLHDSCRWRGGLFDGWQGGGKKDTRLGCGDVRFDTSVEVRTCDEAALVRGRSLVFSLVYFWLRGRHPSFSTDIGRASTKRDCREAEKWKLCCAPRV